MGRLLLLLAFILGLVAVASTGTVGRHAASSGGGSAAVAPADDLQAVTRIAEAVDQTSGQNLPSGRGNSIPRLSLSEQGNDGSDAATFWQTDGSSADGDADQLLTACCGVPRLNLSRAAAER